MDSIKNIYKIGYGPSSSHTMGPQIAAKRFLEKNPDADRFYVELYGSLALTGRGHLTDYVIKKTLGENRTKVKFDINTSYEYHPNGLKFFAYKDDKEIDSWLVFSVGGGSLRELGEERSEGKAKVYPHKAMDEILLYCEDESISLVDYVKRFDDCTDYLNKVLDVMLDSINRGLSTSGTLPGSLRLERKAKEFYTKYKQNCSFSNLMYASALAVAEENASGGIIVTCPTCGASGVVPSVIYPQLIINKVPKEKLVEGLMVAGLIGNIIKYNGSISGAEVGCQGEIGSASSMAASLVAYLVGGSNKQIEYAAEIALEHHLGLTCDPIDGLVQIPCIERNAIAASMAFDSAKYACLTDGNHRISFDYIVGVMKETGKDLSNKYKETSEGGLAKIIKC